MTIKTTNLSEMSASRTNGWCNLTITFCFVALLNSLGRSRLNLCIMYTINIMHNCNKTHEMNMHKTNYCSVLYDVPLIYLLFSDLEPKLHIKIVGLIKEQSFHIARSIIEVSSRVQKFWFNGVHCPSV